MDDLTTAWLADLERRHLADLTISEVARALRALSSCYVERRARLADGDALATRGKRAAFALFYGPLHFFVVREIVRSLSPPEPAEIVDLGCGTGAAALAWAEAARVPAIRGFDRSSWAVDEANAAYRLFGVAGRAVRRDLSALDRRALRAHGGTGVLAAYTLNELDGTVRQRVLADLLAVHADGASVLVVEPIARRMAPWWDDWAGAFSAAGGRADEWRFATALPPTQQKLAIAAGLDPRELKGRSLAVWPRKRV
jgi:SAM-dependent methyltransferase